MPELNPIAQSFVQKITKKQLQNKSLGARVGTPSKPSKGKSLDSIVVVNPPTEGQSNLGNVQIGGRNIIPAETVSSKKLAEYYRGQKQKLQEKTSKIKQLPDDATVTINGKQYTKQEALDLIDSWINEYTTFKNKLQEIPDKPVFAMIDGRPRSKKETISYLQSMKTNLSTDIKKLKSLPEGTIVTIDGKEYNKSEAINYLNEQLSQINQTIDELKNAPEKPSITIGGKQYTKQEAIQYIQSRINSYKKLKNKIKQMPGKTTITINGEEYTKSEALSLLAGEEVNMQTLINELESSNGQVSLEDGKLVITTTWIVKPKYEEDVEMLSHPSTQAAAKGLEYIERSSPVFTIASILSPSIKETARKANIKLAKGMPKLVKTTLQNVAVAGYTAEENLIEFGGAVVTLPNVVSEFATGMQLYKPPKFATEPHISAWDVAFSGAGMAIGSLTGKKTGLSQEAKAFLKLTKAAPAGAIAGTLAAETATWYGTGLAIKGAKAGARLAAREIRISRIARASTLPKTSIKVLKPALREEARGITKGSIYSFEIPAKGSRAQTVLSKLSSETRLGVKTKIVGTRVYRGLLHESMQSPDISRGLLIKGAGGRSTYKFFEEVGKSKTFKSFTGRSRFTGAIAIEQSTKQEGRLFRRLFRRPVKYSTLAIINRETERVVISKPAGKFSFEFGETATRGAKATEGLLVSVQKKFLGTAAKLETPSFAVALKSTKAGVKVTDYVIAGTARAATYRAPAAETAAMFGMPSIPQVKISYKQAEMPSMELSQELPQIHENVIGREIGKKISTSQAMKNIQTHIQTQEVKPTVKEISKRLTRRQRTYSITEHAKTTGVVGLTPSFKAASQPKTATYSLEAEAQRLIRAPKQKTAYKTAQMQKTTQIQESLLLQKTIQKEVSVPVETGITKLMGKELYVSTATKEISFAGGISTYAPRFAFPTGEKISGGKKTDIYAFVNPRDIHMTGGGLGSINLNKQDIDVVPKVLEDIRLDEYTAQETIEEAKTFTPRLPDLIGKGSIKGIWFDEGKKKKKKKGKKEAYAFEDIFRHREFKIPEVRI